MTSQLFDCRGLPMTAASQDAVHAYDLFVRRFMAHGADAAPRLKAVGEADPDLLLGHCARGFCALILGRQELRKAARESLLAAQRSLDSRGGTARERMYVAALAAFCDGAFMEASERLDRCLEIERLDGYAVKLVHGVRFMLGDSTGMLRSTAAVLPAWSDSVPDAGYVHGCHAFGLEEVGDLGAAEVHARHALALARDDAWAFHAIAHVHEMRDEPEAGMAWLDGGAADIDGTGNLAYHIAWHKAIFLLEIKDYEACLDLYDRRVRANPTDDFRDISNAVSLLVRLESAGVAVGGRWLELADKASARTQDMALVFAALHYLAALIADQRWPAVEHQLEAMQSVADAGAGDQARLFRSVGLPYARALVDSHRGDGLEAALALARCLPRLQTVGGSHAQRDLFFKIIVDRLEATGEPGTSRELLAARLVRRPRNRWALERLARLEGPGPAAAQAAE
ncbi:MAG: tetratricopeptide repeat protein [Alphaproteobacteria bacterium]